MVSVATAVDYAAQCMHAGKENGVAAVSNDVHILLGRSLHRLAQGQGEMKLNCDDDQQLSQTSEMAVLLALRCLLGVGDDSLALESLNGNGLYDALYHVHLDEVSFTDEDDETFEPRYLTLRTVKLMADFAAERGMHQTSMCLQRLCAQQLSQMGRFVLDIGDFELSLGEMQKKIIQSASSAKEVLDVYGEIDGLVEKHCKGDKGGKCGVSFYSEADLTWFARDANNRAVQHDLLGDDQTAAKLFAIALNLLPFCGKDLQCHAQVMNSSYQQVMSRMANRGDSLSSIWSLISE